MLQKSNYSVCFPRYLITCLLAFFCQVVNFRYAASSIWCICIVIFGPELYWRANSFSNGLSLTCSNFRSVSCILLAFSVAAGVVGGIGKKHAQKCLKSSDKDPYNCFKSWWICGGYCSANDSWVEDFMRAPPGDKSFNTETAFLADKTFLQLSLLIVITVWCIFCLHWLMSCTENCASWLEPVGVGPIKYLE